MKSGLSATIKQNGLDTFSTAGKSYSIVCCRGNRGKSLYGSPFLKIFHNYLPLATNDNRMVGGQRKTSGLL